MRKLGVSVYPSNATLEENINYLNLTKKYGYSRLFLCMLSILDKEKGINQEKLEETKKIIKHASSLNFEVIVDISSTFLEQLNLSFKDLSWFKDLGVSGIRLDMGFGGNEEAIMTYNKENLLIELNVSSNSATLDNIMSYRPNTHNLIGCHNFYPKKRSALTREIFENCSLTFKAYGLRVAAFVSAPSAKFGPWPVTEGLCTLEEHRTLPIDVQAKDLFYSNLVDDVIIANCFASEEEIKTLANVARDIITLDVALECDISPVEQKIAFEELHFFRGDASKYSIRSTMPRVYYKKDTIPSKNTRYIHAGDVYIENDNYLNYKGELHIALESFENTGGSNVIGKLGNGNEFLLQHIQPWSKFRLNQL